MNQIERETIRLYLLGRLDQANLSQIEERLLTDETFYDELVIAEDELADQYLANELTNEERLSFEAHFLSAPERRQKLRFARSLRRYVSQATGKSAEEDESPIDRVAGTVAFRSQKRGLFSFLPLQNSAIAYSLAAAVLLAVIGISWAVFNNLRPTSREPGNLLAVTLTPGLTREGGETKTINIPPGTDSVQLQLELGSNEYQGYRAELLSGERATLLVKEDLKPDPAAGKNIINLIVPAELLKRDDYRVKLSGRRPDRSYEDVSGYVFRVVE